MRMTAVSLWWCDLDMRYREICKAIFSLGMYKERYGVELMAELLELFGHPQLGLHIIHIAGTNGKGSTAFYTASVLHEAGHHVGLYTSPHLVEPTERIRIDGAVVSEDVFAATGREVLDRLACAGMEGTASDVLLLMAVLLFQRCGCDYAVIETGLGGSLDSTNALTDSEGFEEVIGEKPRMPAAVTCITRIGLDHMAVLGETVGEIAANKAGILKRGTQAVLADNDSEAMEVLEDRCTSQEIPYWKVSEQTGIDQWLQQHFPERYRTYQRENMANAVMIAKILGLSQEIWYRGLREAVIPGRLQTLCRTDGDGILLLDGAHNPSGAAALADSLKECFPGRHFCCIIGIVKDKDAEGILEAMLPLLEEVFLVPTGSVDRRMQKEPIMEFLRGMKVPVRSCMTLQEAFVQTCDRDLALVFGSLYLIGEVLHEFSGTNRSFAHSGIKSECK